MVKSLISHGKITTTVTKAKELRRVADRMITLAKKNTLASRRQAAAALMIVYNTLSTKEGRAIKKGGKVDDVYNADRQVLNKLFGDLSQRFTERQGGYTRITRLAQRIGDNAPTCLLEYLPK
jgi:large subunit ribosomal protein L17